MMLVAQVKVLVCADEKERLLATMRRVNEACCWVAERALELKTANKWRLQKLFYAEVRSHFGLSAQHTVRVFAKVSAAYRRDKSKLCRFTPTGAIAYDERSYSFRRGFERVSILTLDGRIIVDCAVGQSHRARLEGKRGQAVLTYRKDRGGFYLLVSVDVPRGSTVEPTGWLGVDLGIRNLAVDSDKQFYSGEKALAARAKVARFRSALQSRGTKSARRRLRALSRRERRFNTYTNHVISKSIVRKAKDTERGIAIEDLSGIRERATVRKAQRARLHSWPFYQLRSFIAYKAALSGVDLVAVDPRDTSRTCLKCRKVDKASRRSQSEFVCTGCGLTEHADVIGACNVALRAEVIRPIVSAARLGTVDRLLDLSQPQLC